jgi:hypothetical protein
MNLIGFIDEIYEDVDRGLVVVRDAKTGKTLATQSAGDDMMDSQLQLYAWGVTPLLQQWGAGPARAVSYDRTRSVRGSMPQLTTMGRLSASTTDWSLETYLEFAAGPDGNGQPWRGRKVANKEEYLPGGVYQAEQSVIDRLSTPVAKSVWFQRTMVPLSRHVVTTHLRSAVDSATDIWRTQKRTERTLEAARNMSRDNCRWCDYASICRAQMIGGPEGEYSLDEHGLRDRDNSHVLALAMPGERR